MILFDVGIGDTFNARIAGNVVNDDLLEFRSRLELGFRPTYLLEYVGTL